MSLEVFQRDGLNLQCRNYATIKRVNREKPEVRGIKSGSESIFQRLSWPATRQGSKRPLSLSFCRVSQIFTSEHPALICGAPDLLKRLLIEGKRTELPICRLPFFIGNTESQIQAVLGNETVVLAEGMHAITRPRIFPRILRHLGPNRI